MFIKIFDTYHYLNQKIAKNPREFAGLTNFQILVEARRDLANPPFSIGVYESENPDPFFSLIIAYKSIYTQPSPRKVAKSL